jgi:hypothetical protein
MKFLLPNPALWRKSMRMGRGRKGKEIKMKQRRNQAAKKARAKTRAEAVRKARAS